jgi:non-canonical (house-cleaning) NTP pyrophosphatase
MTVVLASTSAIKIRACLEAFPGLAAADLLPVAAPSGVPAQPLNEEALTGARNRLEAARALRTQADYYVSIENGLREEEGHFIDRAVVLVARGTGAPVVAVGDGVEFPADCVEEARRRGFRHCTVGQVLKERGRVANAEDPHLTLGGRSRVATLVDALRKALAALPGAGDPIP